MILEAPVRHSLVWGKASFKGKQRTRLERALKEKLIVQCPLGVRSSKGVGN